MPPDYLVSGGRMDDKPSSNDDCVTLDEWIIQGGIGRTSYAILAAQSCEEDVQELQRNERQRIVDKYNHRDWKAQFLYAIKIIANNNKPEPTSKQINEVRLTDKEQATNISEVRRWASNDDSFELIQ